MARSGSARELRIALASFTREQIEEMYDENGISVAHAATENKVDKEVFSALRIREVLFSRLDDQGRSLYDHAIINNNVDSIGYGNIHYGRSAFRMRDRNSLSQNCKGTVCDNDACELIYQMAENPK
ncbi:MAG: hypothetical protein AAGE76_15590 [Pseudomonadota bacterium]